ncbi:MAG TPA: hypothetical protein VN632_04555 [Stellaceae bacterium]|nr:hypothetical protein [Stellaceae bacterium]
MIWRLLAPVCVIVLALIEAAPAKPPAHVNPALHAWFESLKEPGTGIGCCSEADCHILQADELKQTKDGYQIRVRNLWIKVPPDKILEHQWNPTGGVVACYGPGRDAGDQDAIKIYCFIRGTET